ncbi:hypothetical protein SETIT_9G095600v2 [Setaria italica]|uniref:DUF4220 domain-containing protein n=1 Tax=Setaria italica TaxID=4555 RepID=A0A368SF02_SETIT|nr:hypothetical protein SETIT_9G095600v2 [Setaria italica]
MPRIGDPNANSLHKVAWELLFLGCTTAVCYFQREYIRPGRPDFLPRLTEFAVGMLGIWGFTNSYCYLILDAIDSPHARRDSGRI